MNGSRRRRRYVTREVDEPWLIWCNLNSEADAIEAMLPNALQVAGRHSIDLKVSRLFGFKEGRPPILVSKPSLAGHGMNWQHCSRMVFVGLTDSFEQIYQAIRRCWRFGQSRPVRSPFCCLPNWREISLLTSGGKRLAFDAMLDRMADHMRDLMRDQVIGGHRERTPYNPTKKMELPSWLTAI